MLPNFFAKQVFVERIFVELIFTILTLNRQIMPRKTSQKLINRENFFHETNQP